MGTLKPQHKGSANRNPPLLALLWCKAVAKVVVVQQATITSHQQGAPADVKMLQHRSSFINGSLEALTLQELKKPTAIGLLVPNPNQQQPAPSGKANSRAHLKRGHSTAEVLSAPAEIEPSPNPVLEAQAPVGSKVSVYWQGEQKHFTAEVVSYNHTTTQRELHYSDGDRELVMLHEEKWRLLSKPIAAPIVVDQPLAAAAAGTDGLHPSATALSLTCMVCNVLAMEGDQLLSCTADGCIFNSHVKCAGLAKRPRRPWLCAKCTSKPLSRVLEKQTALEEVCYMHHGMGTCVFTVSCCAATVSNGLWGVFGGDESHVPGSNGQAIPNGVYHGLPAQQGGQHGEFHISACR